MSFIVKSCVKNKQTNKYFTVNQDARRIEKSSLICLHQFTAKVYNHTYLVHVQKCSYVSNQSNEVQRRAKSIRSL
jgi:hypothetical protein